MSVCCWFSQTHTKHIPKGRFVFLFYIYFFVNVTFLLSGAGRDLSAREMVVLSNLKATEEPSLCARFPEKRIKLLFYLDIFQEHGWVQFSSLQKS